MEVCYLIRSPSLCLSVTVMYSPTQKEEKTTHANVSVPVAYETPGPPVHQKKKIKEYHAC